MTTHTHPLINPVPVDEIRQDNAHRDGASNHLQGSGVTPMVGNSHTPDPATVEAVRLRLFGQSRRYMTFDHRGVSIDRLALVELVAEIVTEHTADLQARCAVSDDSVLELLHDLEGGTA